MLHSRQVEVVLTKTHLAHKGPQSAATHLAVPFTTDKPNPVAHSLHYKEVVLVAALTTYSQEEHPLILMSQGTHCPYVAEPFRVSKNSSYAHLLHVGLNTPVEERTFEQSLQPLITILQGEQVPFTGRKPYEHSIH